MTQKLQNNKSLNLVLIVYVIFFFAVWAAYTLVLQPIICNALGEETLISSLLRSGVIKNLVWTLPAALLIVKYRSQCMVSLKEMFTQHARDWMRFLPVFLIFAVYIFISAWRTHGEIGIVDSFGIDEIITVLFVGLTEELVFRGWLLNATYKASDPPKKQYLAIGLNALLFLCIHFPIWISKGIFVSNFISLGFLGILVLSVVFSMAFIRTKNIVIPIALHMFWDLLIFMLI